MILRKMLFRGRLQPGCGLLLLALLVTGCTTSDTIIKLPPPKGLPDLADLEKHLDYKDPDDGRPDYIPRRASR